MLQVQASQRAGSIVREAVLIERRPPFSSMSICFIFFRFRILIATL
jgi:hypothetical protein